MLEKINTLGHEKISSSDPAVLDILKSILTHESEPVFYEIGVGIGATTLPVVQLMNNKGSVFLFSREEEVKELSADLRQLGFNNIDDSWGSPSKTFSGYHFQLAQGYLSTKLPAFDLAYIDGAHVFHFDAPAACVLKELCKVGGYMLFDDWSWTMANSATLNPMKEPGILNHYDMPQIREFHVQLVCKVIMDTDQRFEFLGLKEDTAVYKRIL